MTLRPVPARVTNRALSVLFISMLPESRDDVCRWRHSNHPNRYKKRNKRPTYIYIFDLLAVRDALQRFPLPIESQEVLIDAIDEVDRPHAYLLHGDALGLEEPLIAI